MPPCQATRMIARNLGAHKQVGPISEIGKQYLMLPNAPISLVLRNNRASMPRCTELRTEMSRSRIAARF
jgi:hypothetical protein